MGTLFVSPACFPRVLKGLPVKTFQYVETYQDILHAVSDAQPVVSCTDSIAAAIFEIYF